MRTLDLASSTVTSAPFSSTERHNVLSANLNDARPLSTSSRQQCPKIQIVGKDKIPHFHVPIPQWSHLLHKGRLPLTNELLAIRAS